MTDLQELSYLPIEVSGQIFGIPMAEVVAIRQMHGGEPLESVVVEGAVGLDGHPALRPIDLGRLFWDSASSDLAGYVVVVTTPQGACALLVDGVRAARSAPPEAHYPLPRLMAPVGWLFAGIVSEGDALVLILNSEGLVAQLRQVAPDLIVEYMYAA